MDLKRWFAIFFLLSKDIQKVFSLDVANFQSTNNRDLLVQCSYNLVKKYFFSGEVLSGSVLTMSLISAAPFLQNQIAQAFHLDPDTSWSVVIRYPKRDKHAPFVLQEKPLMYFVTLENLDDEDIMTEIFDDWKSMPNWNPLAQFIVLLLSTEQTEDEMTEIMVDIILLFFSKKIFNINVIAQTQEDGKIYSKTAFPYDPDNSCGTRIISFKTLDVCAYVESDDSVEDDNEAKALKLEEFNRGFFLDKIPKDLSGCPLVAYSRSWEPYMFEEEGQMKGIEWKLVQTIAERLHIEINILMQNKNLFHIFQGLIDGKIDIVIGGIDEDPNLTQFVSATVPYLQDDLTWCVAKARKTLHWLNFVQVFNSETYAAYFGFITCNAITIYTIQKFPHIKEKLCNDFFGLMLVLTGFALSQSSGTIGSHLSLRICVLMSLAAAVIIGSTYNSFLVSSLTSPNTLPQIKKTTELLEHKMEVTGSVEIIRHLEKQGSIFRYIRQEFLMCYNIEECLQKAAHNEHSAVAVSRQYSIHNPRIPRDKLYCFDSEEHIYTYLVTMLMPKKFHLFHQINPIIQYVIESGHLLKWTRDLELERVLKSKENLDENRVMILEVGQILGILASTLILLGISTFVFMIEIQVHRIYTRGTRIKLVKSLHRYFSKTKQN